MAVLTFEHMAAQYDPAIAQGVNQVISNAISGNAETVTEALTLYVIIIGLLLCFREMTYRTFVTHAMRAGAISALMVYGTFNTMIATPAMNTIPLWIAQTVNAQAAVHSAPQQFDLLWSASLHLESAILEQATGLENLGFSVTARLYTLLAGGLLTIVFWCWEFSRATMGLIVAVAPFVLWMYLFETTRQIPMRVFHKGIGILILQLLLSITVQLMLQGNSYILLTAAQNAGDLEAQIGAYQDVLIFFFFGTALVIFTPAIAAYIGGGIALGVGGAIAQTVMNTATAGIAGAARAGRAGSRAIQRARGK